LRFNRYQSTLECFEAEERTKLVTSKTRQMNIHPGGGGDDSASGAPLDLDTFPRLYRFFESDKVVEGRERAKETKMAKVENMLEKTMISARQIFAVAVDCVHQMSQIVKDNKDMQEKLENYKI
jgi:hypothetical protein